MKRGGVKRGERPYPPEPSARAEYDEDTLASVRKELADLRTRNERLTQQLQAAVEKTKRALGQSHRNAREAALRAEAEAKEAELETAAKAIKAKLNYINFGSPEHAAELRDQEEELTNHSDNRILELLRGQPYEEQQNLIRNYLKYLKQHERGQEKMILIRILENALIDDPNIGNILGLGDEFGEART